MILLAFMHAACLFVYFLTFLTRAHFSYNFICGEDLKPVLEVETPEDNLYLVLLGTWGCYQLRTGQL